MTREGDLRGWAGVVELVRLAGSPAAWRDDAGDAEIALSGLADPPAAARRADLAAAVEDRPGLDQLSRRMFFKLAGAGAATAGLAACSSRPAREIRPYANQPPELTPGVPLHYATALVEDGFATGVIVASQDGRPIKVEGNPEHPASLGATRAIEQAAVLSLFDPQRARQITDRGAAAAWSTVEQLLEDAAARGGAGLQLVLEPTSSLQVIDLVARVRAALPAAQFTFWSPFALRSSLAGNRIAFGRPLQTQLDLRAAEVVVTLDADLVADHPMALAYARQLSDRRRVVDGSSAMSRLYSIEASYTPTGVIADHRLAASGSQIARVAIELCAAVIRAGAGGALAERLAGPLAGRAPASERARWITAAAGDLVRAVGRSVVAVGERQPPVVHAIAAALNSALGSVGRTVAYSEPVVFEAGQPGHELAGVARAIDRGDVSCLLVLGGNPAYTAPADLAFGAAIERVANSLYLGLHDNETARACRFVVPGLHDLEQWDAARAYDGTLTPIQPLIEPLFDGRSVAELLHRLLGDLPATARDRFRAAWSRHATSGAATPPLTDHSTPHRDSSAADVGPTAKDAGSLGELEAALAAGVASRPAPRVAVTLAWDAIAQAITAAVVPGPGTDPGSDPGRPPGTLELELRPHPFVHDGRHANNPWLLELPEPITKLTWDNAAQLSPRTAARLGVETGDVLRLRLAASGPAADGNRATGGGDAIAAARGASPPASGNLAIRVPAVIVPGHADHAITLHAGFGRDGAGERVARGVGVNAFALWTTTGGFHPAVAATATGDHHALAITQVVGQTEDRPIVLAGTLRALAGQALRDEIARHRGPQPSIYEPFPAAGAQWAMQIDLTTCTGCTACVMACAAENNTPVVGKRAVRNKREMHWLRIDRYIIGSADAPVVAVQPMACQHCELAPCEYVCPVEATTHSPDGLNEMTYNRCIGTRFCSNNCPYKVRRFNWFDWKDHDGLRILGRNPDVTVRDRGVMEKCTYCVQRIRRAEIDARIAGRQIGSDDVRTACQQACPTQAISFGSIADPRSTVAEQRRRPHSYAVLHDQGTVPRTQYLARIRNPNGGLP
jgi:Fe-S-cluster-containing dehydrogenase component/anaerobic selenocysteine-containing dehydrogenase